MLIKYDKEVDSRYIVLSNKKKKKGIVARTKQVYPWLMVDYDKEGNVFGIEILNASLHQGAFVVADKRVTYLETPKSRASGITSSFLKASA